MKLTFLGTGAPEGNPSPFCECEHCTFVRKHKGRNIRLQSSLLINEDLLIDFGPDVTRSFNNLGLSMNSLKTILITHCHFDHYFAGNFLNRLQGPTLTPVQDLRVMGPKRMRKLSADWIISPRDQKLHFTDLEPFQTIKINGYDVTTFAITQQDIFAGHGMGFVVSDKSAKILYAVDTSSFSDKTWNTISGFVFDVVVLDETFGKDDPPKKDHMNIKLFMKTVTRMQSLGMLTKKTKIYTQHMSHHNSPHALLVKELIKKNIHVPYDGLKIYVK